MSNNNASKKRNDQTSSTPSASRPSPSPFTEVIRSLPPQIRCLLSETVEGSDVDTHSTTLGTKATTGSITKKRDSSSYPPISSNRNNDYRRSGKNSFFSRFFWGDLAVALAVGAAVGASIVAGFFTGILIVTDPSL
mmetsp:Transcript_32791/g.39284  ORF Transcript_32791/g.39284 Transcript_32791/m.39284 type:complete len:136 (+) Transcript_32791:21-428(+)|eukprot:CAMPEP_0198250194 /NCGR_PEP_ID=MMETSP1447-20131203/1477_1 /TAXON_ID=420782 /ORGANISM="Chaetoceros dichaeta, Strain CCMP1751" /LENGTH=135 /DNA_ID=CAMNT_0043934997 /DNA_START=7 /DNA_END=414 /DNA_ORIENTATION=+